MDRKIGFQHERLQSTLPCTLLDSAAPRSCAFLWALAGQGPSFMTNHAIWTGPELSIPLPESILPREIDRSPVPPENAPSFPRAGDVMLAWLAAGSARGLPPGDFFDIGLFYDEGGRLLMPFGWLQANVAARIDPADLPLAHTMARDIRQHGSFHRRIVQL